MKMHLDWYDRSILSFVLESALLSKPHNGTSPVQFTCHSMMPIRIWSAGRSATARAPRRRPSSDAAVSRIG
jgi:hypothetical protein